uniref:Death-associated protein 1 n=1 Tax=Oncorhynchus kisutch TaxID=8019 RepID=A0A8C7G8Z8_ONCKI
MSSPPKEKIETKGGHLPAVKAGGMRIVQKHQGAAPPETPPIKDEDEDFVEEPSPPKPTVVVSGVVTKTSPIISFTTGPTQHLKGIELPMVQMSGKTWFISEVNLNQSEIPCVGFYRSL